MTWTQVYDPLKNIGLSALVAALPIFFLFWALAVKRMKGHIAGLLTALVAVVVAVAAYGMPAKLALLSTANGALYGFFPIGWIVLTAVFLYNVTVKTGQFEIIKNSIASITDDRRLQALLIAFSFGAFLEGAAGFGTPVAISGAMLVGLGFNPLYAAGICLIANTAPVAFGGVGIPIIVAGQVTGIPDMAISQMVGRTLPLLSAVVPLYLVILMAGWKGAKEVLPAIAVSGLSFAVAQWYSANYMSPMLPDIIASLVSIIALTVFLKFWKPKNIWRFPNEPKATATSELKYSAAEILRAWAPFIILTIFITAWGLKPVKEFLDNFALIKFHIPGLDNTIVKGGKPMEAIFKFNYLSAAGTAILISAFVSIIMLGMRISDGVKVFVETVKTLKFPLVTIMAVLGFAYIANFSGMSTTMGLALSKTGKYFPFFAPFLGWLGVFITGSDTSANALFGKLQQVTAGQIGVDPVVTVAANTSGGVTGKMISPQSIAVATASVGLVGEESNLFRFTVKHSLIFATVIGVITTLQAYVLKWIIPSYELITATVAKAAPNLGQGATYLGITIALVIMLFTAVVALNARKRSVVSR